MKAIYRKARGAGPITFRTDRDLPAYAILTMAQVERLRERDTFDKFIVRARREFGRRHYGCVS